MISSCRPRGDLESDLQSAVAPVFDVAGQTKIKLRYLMRMRQYSRTYIMVSKMQYYNIAGIRIRSILVTITHGILLIGIYINERKT